MGPEVLAEILHNIKRENKDPRLIIGYENADDAAVYLLNDSTVIMHTIDFFTPMVDDPYLFGQIAAANALSDIYAMGGQPLLAANICCFPINCMSTDTIGEILRGGLNKVEESGAVLSGGHTVEDQEPKYGLSVIGLGNPIEVMSNDKLEVNDVLVLTKPIGTGIVLSAIKGGVASADDEKACLEGMALLNKNAAAAAVSWGVKACTDITGFGLAGHLLEMLRASNKSADLFLEAIPLYPHVNEYIDDGLMPAGLYRNMDFVSGLIEISPGIKGNGLKAIYDPQTSGGLLLSISVDKLPSLLTSMMSYGIDGKPIGRVSGEDGARIRLYRNSREKELIG